MSTGRRTIAAAALSAALVGGCAVPGGAPTSIEGDPLPNQGRPGLEEPDLGSTLAQEAPNPVDLPPTLLAAARERDDLTTLVELVEEAGLEDLLTPAERHTLFAPSDDAFAAVPPEVLAIYRQDDEALRRLLRFHLVRGAFGTGELESVEAVANLGGTPIDLEVEDDRVSVEDAAVVTPNVGAEDGVIHVVDTVLFVPPVPDSEG